VLNAHDGPDDAPGRRSRRRAVVVASLLLGAAILLTGLVGVTWLARYQPLAYRGGICCSAGGTAEHSIIRTHVLEDMYFVNRSGGTFEIGFDITNEGRLPVTIEGLADGDSFVSEISGMSRHSIMEFSGGNYPDIVAFEPVTIEPGDGRFLRFSMNFDGARRCRDSGGGYSFTSFRSFWLRYSYAGVFEGTARVEAPFRVAPYCGQQVLGHDVFDRSDSVPR
jgi:hypothetical protein